MTKKRIATLLPGVVLTARPRARTVIGGLAIAACAVMALSTATSAHSATTHAYTALGQTSITTPIPDCVGGGGVGDY
jgi:hypothetical protein